MTDKATLLALAERVEALDGPNRNLDADIMRATGLGGLKADYAPHPYTASIDAALTLVPEGWAVERWQIWPGEPSTLDLLETKRSGDQWVRDGWQGKVDACAATPALALCAAALRARAETQP